MTCLVDSSAWIESLRKDGDPVIRETVRALILSGDAALCNMIRLELWNGARGEKEKAQLADIEKAVQNLALDEDVWSLAFDLARASRGRGLTIPASDIIVVACARRHGASLLHRDSHFDALNAIDP